MYKDLEIILSEHEKLLDKTSYKIIKILKCNCETLGQFNKEVEKVIKHLQYEGNYKQSSLIKKIKKLAQKEVNDLPLTNRSI